jgi:hypothetical protein
MPYLELIPHAAQLMLSIRSDNGNILDQRLHPLGAWLLECILQVRSPTCARWRLALEIPQLQPHEIMIQMESRPFAFCNTSLDQSLPSGIIFQKEGGEFETKPSPVLWRYWYRSRVIGEYD